MLLTVMRECRNFFEISREAGVFAIESGVITLGGSYLPGQHIAITGSLLNDGVYLLQDTLYTVDGAADETFSGAVYGLRVPRDFLALCEEIQAFADGPVGKASNLVSESVLGVHSYSVATGKDGAPIGWKTVFGGRLTPFRRMFTEVIL